MSDVRSTPVSDIMTTQIEMVAQSTPVDYAVKLLVEKHISGMPVTDDEGSLCGVVSSIDVLRSMRGEAPRSGKGTSFYADLEPTVLFDPKMLLDGSLHGTVGDYMSPLIVSIPLDTSVQDAARTMTVQKVHRLLVVDKNANLAGIVTATDIMRHVAG
jgi:CBS domain-containing protein